MTKTTEAATPELPELPDPLRKIEGFVPHPNGAIGRVINEELDPCGDYYDADQMREYALSAIAATTAARVPEGLVDLLRELRPKFGAVGSRDVDVAEQQRKIDAAIAMLATALNQDREEG